MTTITRPNGELVTAFPGRPLEKRMSLDFVVLGADNTPEKTVALGGDLHNKLLAVAASQHLHEMCKFNEYYEDVEIGANSLPALLREIAILRNLVDSVELSDFLSELVDLTNFAISQGKALHALAD